MNDISKARPLLRLRSSLRPLISIAAHVPTVKSSGDLDKPESVPAHHTSSGSAASEHRPRAILGSIAATWLVLFVTRVLPASPALNGSFTSVDEVELTLTTLDRVLGLPTTSLAWPATVVQLVTLPFQLVLHAISGSAHGVEGFATALADTYRDPARAVFWQRMVSLTAFTTAATAWVPYLMRRGTPAWLAMGVVVAGALQPLVWLHSYVATGEAIGMALTLVGLLAAAPGNARALGTGALILGLAFSARLTLAPCWLLLPCLSRDRPKLTKLLLLSCVGFTFGCPHVWLEPVRLAKSVVGNLLRSGVASGTRETWLLLEAAPPLSWLLGVAVAYHTFRAGWARPMSQTAKLCLVVSCLVFAALLLSVSGRRVEARYLLFLPLALWTLVLCWVRDAAPATVRARPSYTVPLMIGLTVLIALQVPSFFRFARQRSRYLHAMNELTRLVDGNHRWLIDARLAGSVMHRMSAARLDALRAALEANFEKTRSKPSFAVAHGLPPTVANVFASNFTEDEQAIVGRLRAAAVVEPPAPLTLELFGDTVGSDATLEQALVRLHRGDFDRLVVMASPVGGVPIIAALGEEAEGRIFVQALH